MHFKTLALLKKNVVVVGLLETRSSEKWNLKKSQEKSSNIVSEMRKRIQSVRIKSTRTIERLVLVLLFGCGSLLDPTTFYGRLQVCSFCFKNSWISSDGIAEELREGFWLCPLSSAYSSQARLGTGLTKLWPVPPSIHFLLLLPQTSLVPSHNCSFCRFAFAFLRKPAQFIGSDIFTLSVW